MGWIARSPLAMAVSRAGGLGIIETSSGETENCQREIAAMLASGLPFGVNLPIRFLKDDAMLRYVCESGIRFVTTSAGSPAKFVAPLKAAGIAVYHAVPTLEAALKCADAGVDGLVVEGSEGGGFKNPEEVSTLVLLQAIRDREEDTLFMWRPHLNRVLRLDTARANMPLRIVGMVQNKNDANVAAGTTDSGAERLSASGSFVKVQAGGRVELVQAYRIDEAQIRALGGGDTVQRYMSKDDNSTRGGTPVLMPVSVSVSASVPDEVSPQGARLEFDLSRPPTREEAHIIRHYYRMLGSMNKVKQEFWPTKNNNMCLEFIRASLEWKETKRREIIDAATGERMTA
jgi:hypothetical protein